MLVPAPVLSATRCGSQCRAPEKIDALFSPLVKERRIYSNPATSLAGSFVGVWHAVRVQR